ncbi:hypothetical protein AMS68_003702 [Peltaster fructicola]|uniref:dipeptidyl-peptidase IV n=1 Tax=Peltaster fructicola TaxID=286661 RepID=A0A6H0XU60_9PEZI|nr:hypothetical protein AMS68_003702 [Peltaster fructicola]
MVRTDGANHEESIPLTSNQHDIDHNETKQPRTSASSVSTSSLMFEHISDRAAADAKQELYDEPSQDEFEDEESLTWKQTTKAPNTRARKWLYIVIAIAIAGWILAFFLFLFQRPPARAVRPHDPHATSTPDHGQKVTLDQVLDGKWYSRNQNIQWVAGPNGEDGLLVERGGADNYFTVRDIRTVNADKETQNNHTKVLMKNESFRVGDQYVRGDELWPSPDHKKVLVRSNTEKLWRHSSTGRFWIFDVATQTGQAVDPADADTRIQIASWSPTSDSVVFTRNNNMYIRHLDKNSVDAITTDGGEQYFYGRPDWVYEEEVFQGDSATWWSADGKYIAYLRTNESAVPEFPVQYFLSRPSGKNPAPGEENYPDVRQIKYPKAGAPMSVVNLQLYETKSGHTFEVSIKDDFADDNRLITEVVWAGKTGKLLVKETNRESDILKVILIDAEKRSGGTVREENVAKLDGGWFEVSETTKYVPAQKGAGILKEHIREDDGYIDTVIHNGYDHLAYFSPLDNPTPKLLTEGNWEVVKAPSAIDAEANLVYYVSTQASSIERRIYSVDINKGPSSIQQVTPDDKMGYYTVSFSAGAHFMLLSYKGPDIPWQAIRATPSNKDDPIDLTIEKNEALSELAQKTELPLKIYSTIEVDGFELNVVERRPPHFDDSGKTKYPVLFYLYNGPGYQTVDRTFTVDFQSYVASALGYIVVTVDARGTGYLGRKLRCATRGNLGYWEAHDQIAAGKIWSQKKYVDSDNIAIWGWSYGGFMTLKVLETDAGNTFKYGMAVAPVTDWRLYDSVYTERYMHTPQHNPGGYDNSTISNMTALASNVRFLVMHGVSDDNVHFQNTLYLLDKLDQANVRNYDVHVFPDSDHGIYFHNANHVVYEKLNDWLINAFNGEWLRTENPQPTVNGYIKKR